MEQSLAVHRVLKIILLFIIASCCEGKITLLSKVKAVSLSNRETPCYAFMLNVSLSSGGKQRPVSNTLRCYDDEGMRKRTSRNRKAIKYPLKFSNVEVPKMTELLKLVELKIYVPHATIVEIRHRIVGDPLSSPKFHTITTAQLGWQTFDLTTLFRLATGLGPVTFRAKLILRNFSAPSSQKEDPVWKEKKPMLFVSTEEDNLKWTNLVKSSDLRKFTTTRTEPRLRIVRSASSQPCPMLPLSWSVTSNDLAPVLGLRNRLVFPLSVSLDYCSGACAQSFLMNTHSELQRKFSQKLRGPHLSSVVGDPSNQLPRVPLPCCVPVKYKALDIMYRDNNAIIWRKLENAIAAECGCR